jgi:hypothetical protein
MGQTLYPTAIVAKGGLGGLVTDIDDDPASPDANWCTSGSGSTYSGSGAGTLTLAGQGVGVSTGGDFVHGSSYTFTASQVGVASFGTKSTVAPELFDRCNYPSLSDGEALPVWSTGPEFPWPNYGYFGGDIFYETSETQRGVTTGGMYKATGTEGICADLDTATGDYLYVSWWFKPNDSVQASNSSSKLLRVSDKTNVVNETFSWVTDHTYTSPSDDGGGYYPTLYPSTGSWHFMEAIFKNGAGGWYTLMIDNEVVAYQRPQSLTFDHVWKIGWDSGGVSPNSITFWMDDIYVDSSACRVMLGNASTYSACTAFEMQPPTSWAESSITITVNRGAATVSSTRYLYVINSSNAVVNSTGYLVTVN